MLTCYHCGKGIKGKVTRYVPPIIAIQLGADFCKSFHPDCYQKAEDEAAHELRTMNGYAFNQPQA